ncbi:cytochrome C oxidase subunit IV family protein [Thermicanus aegyptius]|uniref:cytochrome C oxidase subunit IV family protein n=1 Tax=Thermicanus aegyptius TaxID=94009 RepID=UPI000349DB7E|nr:cytochrome C oxidase subunit IV family protein [Thermicanus aegyptius]
MPEEMNRGEFQRVRSETKHHLIAFFVSIVLTLLAFYPVAYGVNPRFTIPFIVVLGAIQAAFQLYIWMHMKDKEHRFPTIYVYVAILVVWITIMAFLFMIWW